MKTRMRCFVEGRFMKKLVLTCILIISIIFIAGCIGEEKTNIETSTDSQSNLQSDCQNPDLMLKPNDLQGLVLGYYTFIAVPKSSTYTKDDSGGEKKYTDVLPLGTRNVGEGSTWMDESGRQLMVSIQKFDSISGLKEEIEEMQQNMERQYSTEEFDFGDPNVGEVSFYCEGWSNDQPDVGVTELRFIYGNNFVVVKVMDEKGKSKNEAIRIAKIIKSRLD